MEKKIDWSSKLVSCPFSKLTQKEQANPPPSSYYWIRHRPGSGQVRMAFHRAGIDLYQARRKLRDSKFLKKLEHKHTTVAEVLYVIVQTLCSETLTNKRSVVRWKRELRQEREKAVNSLRWLLRNAKATQSYLVKGALYRSADQGNHYDFIDLDDGRNNLPNTRIITALRQLTSSDINKVIKTLREETLPEPKPEKRLVWQLVEGLNVLFNSKLGHPRSRKTHPGITAVILDALGIHKTLADITRHLHTR